MIPVWGGEGATPRWEEGETDSATILCVNEHKNSKLYPGSTIKLLKRDRDLGTNVEGRLVAQVFILNGRLVTHVFKQVI